MFVSTGSPTRNRKMMLSPMAILLTLILTSFSASGAQEDPSEPKATPQLGLIQLVGDREIEIQMVRVVPTQETQQAHVPVTVTKYVEKSETVEVEREGKMVTETKAVIVPVTEKSTQVQTRIVIVYKAQTLTKRFKLDAVTLSKVAKNGELGAVEGKKIKRILESPKPAFIVSGSKKIDSAYLAILKRNSLVLMIPSGLQLNESQSKAGSAAASESQAEK
jgi:hypothetical protein